MNEMRAPTVFVSHASADAETAQKVCAALKARGINVRVDHELFSGEDFVFFMNEALQESDHCLVLWSNNVALKSYVGSEISAAFVIDVKQRPSYLLFARLDNRPLPPLFSPRLCVDLASDWENGIRKIAEVVGRDTEVSSSTGKPVIAPSCLASELPSGDESAEVYVCSVVFERTAVVFADLRKDPTAFLSSIVERFGAPSSVDHNGRIGVRIHYFLRGPKGPLLPGSSLRSQGIENGMVIWLELECEPFVIGKQVDVEHSGSTRYRLPTDRSLIMPEAVLLRALNSASKAISENLRKNGLRREGLIPMTMLERPGRRATRIG